MQKNISIITNFGCHSDCWYCIWKGHKLENVCEETDWNKLTNFLVKYQEKKKVSISGGGDCLYESEKYAEWWNKLFNITEELDMLVDVHTREKLWNNFFWEAHINKCAFSSDKLMDDIDYLSWLCCYTQVRITHLVTADTTTTLIAEYLRFQARTGCQLTIKELIGHDDNGMYKIIRNEFPEIYHLDEGDYNIYYMPDNTISKKFLI